MWSIELTTLGYNGEDQFSFEVGRKFMINIKVRNTVTIKIIKLNDNSSNLLLLK